ncbi:unnamed protein product [Diamesa serratosioi]
MEKRDDDLDTEPTGKSLNIFGRNVAEMPCFRNCFLYGSGAGFIVGLGSFMGTSRPQLAMHVGFGTFFCTTLAYWFTCRYQYSQKKFFYSQLQTAMKKQAVYEGTAMEEEMKLKKA